MSRGKLVVTSAVWLFVIGAVAIGWKFWFQPKVVDALALQQKIIQTKNLVEFEAKTLLRTATRPAERPQDVWGTMLWYEYQVAESELIATVTSWGPDKIPSDDDVVAKETGVNKNKSNTIGYWAGNKFKEAGKGFIKGLKDKSPFKKKK